MMNWKVYLKNKHMEVMERYPYLQVLPVGSENTTEYVSHNRKFPARIRTNDLKIKELEF